MHETSDNYSARTDIEDIMEDNYNVGIIGGGPGGYTAAIRAAQKGQNVILFERAQLGGVCLNKGCIPTKTVMHCSDFYKSLKKAQKFGVNISDKSYDYTKIFERKNDVVLKIQKSLIKLVQSYNVQIVNSEAKLLKDNKIQAENKIYNCDNVIIATGAKPLQVKGIESDGTFVLNSDDVLNLQNLPQNILIVGSGAIGVEWARIFSALEKNVTVVELADTLLPLADIDVSKRLERLFKKDKIKFLTSTQIDAVNGNTVAFSDGKSDDFDMILAAVGREPVLPYCEVELTLERKFIKVDEHFETSQKNVYAIGDVNGKIQLAHSAIHQAISVVDYITEKKSVEFDKNKIPCVIYGNPEIAWVGKRSQDCADTNVKISTFPVGVLGKAQADDEIDGFVKVVSCDNKIIGAHVISPEASALVQQYALMIDNNLSPEDIEKTTFAHPTYSESVFESILGLNNLAINLPPVKD